MNYIFKISGKKLTVPPQEEGHWKFVVRPGGWVIAENAEGQRKRLFFQKRRQSVSANFQGVTWHGEVSLERESADQSKRSDADLVAQFPGKIRKVMTQSGAEVNQGDLLVLIEAMKMEFAIRAPFTGKVLTVHVNEGQLIQPGERLVDMEETQLG